MIKGCKNYFSMFGILLYVVNVLIGKFFAAIFAHMKDQFAFLYMIFTLSEKNSVNQNQIYQKHI